MTGVPTKAIEVFYSYTKRDEALLEQLEKHLSSLRRQNLVTHWHSRLIIPGTNYEEEISAHLNTASIILLLVSADFIDSDYCYGTEVMRAVERHAAKEASVIPILLRPVDYEGTPFAKLKGLPTNGKPITSWTKREEAFLDVARGIRKVIEEIRTPSISPQCISQTFWHVPYRRNPYFTNQVTILTHLYNTLRLEKTAILTQQQDISGLGGFGKTQIALEYAYRYCDAYRSTLWVQADSYESLVLGYITLANILQLPKKDTQNQSVTVQTVIHWLNTHNQWLLIFDNADDLSMIVKFLPEAGTGHILITTRSQTLGTPYHNVNVQRMEPPAGTRLLLRRIGILASDAPLDHASIADRTAAKEIVQALDGLPLALDQAGAYIEETGCEVFGYLKRYRTQRVTLLHRRDKLTWDHTEPVAIAWSLSFQEIEQVNPAATELLQLCAFLHPDAIPEELITEGASHLSPKLQALASDLIALDEAMETLRAYSLMDRHPDTRTLSIHRLVQAVLLDTMTQEEQRERAEQVVRAVNQFFPAVEFDSQSFYERYLLHAQACAVHIMHWKLAFPEAARLLEGVGTYLYEHARYSEAEPLYQRALAIREQILGPNHLDTASSLNNLGELYYDRGKYIEAEPLHRRALAIREQVLGLRHPDTASSLNNQANLYMKQGEYGQAEPLHRRALAIREQVLGAQHPDTAQSLSNLAGLYEAQGNYEQAEPLYQRALAIWEQVLGPQHPDTAQSLNNLAALYYAQGKYEQAEPLYQRALAILEQVLGPQHPDTKTIRRNYAMLLRKRHS